MIDKIFYLILPTRKGKVQKYLLYKVILDFEEVDKFEKTPTGKFRFVYREL